MTNSEHFCLRWNDFESNISQAFQSIREEKDFFDVTLACEDEQVQAHKVILSACSPFFRNILRKNPHQHPLLYLKGVRYSEITSILNFMYHGEVNVTQGELNAFLSVAEDLQVKGLTQENSKAAGWRTGESQKSLQKKPPENDEVLAEPPTKRPRGEAGSSRSHEVETVPPVKTEPVSEAMGLGVVSLESQEEAEGVYDPNYDCYYQEEGQYVQEGDHGGERLDGNKEMAVYVLSHLRDGLDLDGRKSYTCSLCDFTHARKEKVRQHVESWHGDAIGIRYKCDYCDKHYKCHSNLRTHVSTNHRLIHHKDTGGVAF